MAHGDLVRHLSTITTLGVLLQQVGAPEQRLILWMSIKDHPHLDQHSPLAAMVLQNIGESYVALGQPLLARQALKDAAARFARLGMRTEQLRTEWSIAKLLMKTQLFDEALPRLRGLRDEFEERQVLAEAGLATLDIVETLLVLDRADEANDECKTLLTTLATANLATTTCVRIALASLREAVDARRTTLELVRSVRYVLDDLAGPSTNQVDQPL